MRRLCSLLVFALATPAIAEEITYTKHVAPILWKNCAGCHRPGEVGPFSLLTYEDAAKRADFIAEITASRRMPPWHPESGYAEFLDDRRLSDADLKTLAAWAAAGAPQGNPGDLPAAPVFPTGWQLGEPDLVLKMPEPFAVPAEGRDVFMCFVLPMALTSDRTVAAVEFRPGNRRVVHHALFFLDGTGQARSMDEKSPGPGYKSFGGIGILPTGALGGWAPGATPRLLPDGMGRMLRAGSDLVLQMHYHPDGKPETDQSEVGIYFTKQPATKIVAGLPMVNRRIRIPAGDRHHEVRASFTLPVEIEAVGVSPHMHYIGREMKLTATLPDGKEQVLVWIKDWDFNWQGQYLYRDRIPLPKGTRLDLVAYYDNTADNPHNPNSPPKLVTFGEQTTDEMCLCGVQYVAKSRGDQLTILQEIAKQQGLGGRLRAALSGASN